MTRLGWAAATEPPTPGRNDQRSATRQLIGRLPDLPQKGANLTYQVFLPEGAAWQHRFLFVVLPSVVVE